MVPRKDKWIHIHWQVKQNMQRNLPILLVSFQNFITKVIYLSRAFRNEDYFTVPGNLLRVQDNGKNSPNPKCFPTTFIEYASDQWFTVESDLLADKVGISFRIFIF